MRGIKTCIFSRVEATDIFPVVIDGRVRASDQLLQIINQRKRHLSQSSSSSLVGFQILYSQQPTLAMHNIKQVFNIISWQTQSFPLKLTKPGSEIPDKWKIDNDKIQQQEEERKECIICFGLLHPSSKSACYTRLLPKFREEHHLQSQIRVFPRECTIQAKELKPGPLNFLMFFFSSLVWWIKAMDYWRRPVVHKKKRERERATPKINIVLALHNM